MSENLEQQIRDNKLEAYKKDLTEVHKKHGMRQQAVMMADEQGIVSLRILAIRVEEETE